MKRGFVKSYRKELDSDIWQMPPIYHRIFTYLLHKASYKDRLFPTARKFGIWILRGQLLTSHNIIADGVSWREKGVRRIPNRKTISTSLQWFQFNQIIDLQSNRCGTYINICNYNTYQQFEPAKVTVEGQVTGQPTGQPMDNRADTVKESIIKTKKAKESKNKNAVKKVVKKFVSEECLEELTIKHPKYDIKANLENFLNFAINRTPQYKDYNAGFRGWMGNTFPKIKKPSFNETLTKPEIALAKSDRETMELIEAERNGDLNIKLLGGGNDF